MIPSMPWEHSIVDVEQRW